MLAWEQAPVLPIYRWFEPELRPPRPESLDDGDLHLILWDVVHKLFRSGSCWISPTTFATASCTG